MLINIKPKHRREPEPQTQIFTESKPESQTESLDIGAELETRLYKQINKYESIREQLNTIHAVQIAITNGKYTRDQARYTVQSISESVNGYVAGIGCKRYYQESDMTVLSPIKTLEEIKLGLGSVITAIFDAIIGVFKKIGNFFKSLFGKVEVTIKDTEKKLDTVFNACTSWHIDKKKVTTPEFASMVAKIYYFLILEIGFMSSIQSSIPDKQAKISKAESRISYYKQKGISVKHNFDNGELVGDIQDIAKLLVEARGMLEKELVDAATTAVSSKNHIASQGLDFLNAMDHKLEEAGKSDTVDPKKILGSMNGLNEIKPNEKLDELLTHDKKGEEGEVVVEIGDQEPLQYGGYGMVVGVNGFAKFDFLVISWNDDKHEAFKALIKSCKLNLDKPSAAVLKESTEKYKEPNSTIQQLIENGESLKDHPEVERYVEECQAFIVALGRALQQLIKTSRKTTDEQKKMMKDAESTIKRIEGTLEKLKLNANANLKDSLVMLGKVTPTISKAILDHSNHIAEIVNEITAMVKPFVGDLSKEDRESLRKGPKKQAIQLRKDILMVDVIKSIPLTPSTYDNLTYKLRDIEKLLEDSEGFKKYLGDQADAILAQAKKYVEEGPGERPELDIQNLSDADIKRREENEQLTEAKIMKKYDELLAANNLPKREGKLKF